MTEFEVFIAVEDCAQIGPAVAILARPRELPVVLFANVDFQCAKNAKPFTNKAESDQLKLAIVTA